MKLKLLCVSPGYFPALRLGGVISSIHSMNKELVKIGVETTVFATNQLLENEIVPGTLKSIDGVRVCYFSYVGWRDILNIRKLRGLLEYIKNSKEGARKFDIVHLHSVWNIQCVIMAHYCKRFNKPYVISPHGMLLPNANRKNRLLKRAYFEIVCRRFMKRADCIKYTTLLEAEKSNRLWRLHSPFQIIYHGYDGPTQKNVPSGAMIDRFPELAHKRIILFLGRISWIKGLDLLVRAYAEIRPRYPDIHLVVAGNDPEGYLDALKKISAGLGLDYIDHADGRDAPGPAVITFTGFLEGDLKESLLDGSALFILPSHSENFGMAAVEAMASRLPVIVTDQVGIAKEIRETGSGIVIPPSVDGIVKGISSLLKDPKSAAAMGKRAHETVRRLFDLKTVARKTKSLYSELVERGTSPCCQ
jgi:glycosyltransferase involved in cell wall biosynthesis